MENSTSQHIEIGWKKELLDGCREKTRHRSRSPGQKKKKYHRLSSDSSSSSSSSGRSESSSSSSGSSGCDLKKKRNERKEKRDEEKKLKKEKRRMQKEKKKEIKKAKKEKRKEEKRLKKMKKSCKETAKGDSSEKDCAVPIELMFSKARAPETPEAYELRQKQIRRVTDPETGRTRLIKGDGEILEEIVSKDRHREINKYATKGDGDFFQRQTVGWQMNK